MKNDRREFLKTVGGASAALAGASAEGQDRAAAEREVAVAALPPTPGGTTGFALDVDGVQVGVLKAYSGGTVGAEVVLETPGADGVIRKHLGRLQNEDLLLSVDGAFFKTPLFNWVGDTLDHSFLRHDGSVRAFDFNFKETRETRFQDALISEVGFPELDAAAKDAALFRIVIKPEQLEVKKGSGQKITPPAGKAKKALRSNFRLKIDGLDNAVKKVNKIDALSVKMRVAYLGGEGCDPFALEPGPLTIDDLVIHCAESFAQELYDWHEDFVIKGACSQKPKEERSGSLELLTPDLKTVLLTVQFKGLGLHKLSPEVNATDSVSRVVASMYCEEVAIK